jgi:hypothetical protein
VDYFRIARDPPGIVLAAYVIMIAGNDRMTREIPTKEVTQRIECEFTNCAAQAPPQQHPIFPAMESGIKQAGHLSSTA